MLRHQKFEIAERKARTLPDKKSRGGEKNSGHGNGSANPKSGDKSPTTGTGDGGGSSPRSRAAIAVAMEADVAEDDGEPEFNSAALVG
jgi:hypothetical protein